MKRFSLWLVLGIVAAAVVGITLAMSRPYQYKGSLIEPPMPAPDFSLRQGTGETFTLSEQKGSVALLFFGYTACPDVCPLTLAEMKRVKSELGRLADQVEVVFITVDPERDTPERMSQYVAGFDEKFIGLSGTEEELAPVYKGYGVYRAKRETGSAAGYLMDHTSVVYLIDPDSNLRLTYAYGTPPEAIAADIRQVLKNAR